MCCIATAAVLSGCTADSGKEPELVLSDAYSGEEFASYPIQDGDTFGVEFIHSVNKSPVRDIYEIRGTEIWNTECIYYGFGAGVEEILLEGEELAYGGNGEMIVSGIDHQMNHMIIVVGTISDHTLYLGGDEISLRDLCGRSSKVLFTVRA